ncbi:hypothetical protein ACLMJK_001011 [Lecanora helva]
MKFISLLPLAALSYSFIIPDEEVMSQVAIETKQGPDSVYDRLPSKDEALDRVESTFSDFIDTSKNGFDQVIKHIAEAGEQASSKAHQAAFDAEAWLESAANRVDDIGELNINGHHGHGKPNQTVYELIANSKYTTKLAALVNEYPDVVEILNGTAANYTVFAPIDKAFEKIPDDAPKPSKEDLKKILLYHVSDDFFPAGRVLVTGTFPSLLSVDTLGIGPQRISNQISLRGLTVNFYSRIIAIDIFGTNGVIHGIDSLLIPPPKTAEIVQLLPGEFSTLELGLIKTGLLEAINDTSTHLGGTVFAPSNFAFQKLGPRVNGFLFSQYGQKYLKALLKYHVVADQTLYSDAYYKAEATDVEENGIPKGYFHIDLATLLKDKSLSVDVARYGRFIRIKINAFATVTIEDGIAADGVIQVVDNVLIPPKSIDRGLQHWAGEELSIDDLKERLEPLVSHETPEEL